MKNTAAICLLFITIYFHNGQGQNWNGSLLNQLADAFRPKLNTTEVTNRTSVEQFFDFISGRPTTTEYDEFLVGDDRNFSTSLRSQTSVSTRKTETTHAIEDVTTESTTLQANRSSIASIEDKMTTAAGVAVTANTSTRLPARTTTERSTATNATESAMLEGSNVTTTFTEETTVAQILTEEIIIAETQGNATTEKINTTEESKATENSTTGIANFSILSSASNVSETITVPANETHSTPGNTNFSLSSSPNNISEIIILPANETNSTTGTKVVTAITGNFTANGTANESSTLTLELMTTGLAATNGTIQEPSSLIQASSTEFWESSHDGKDCQKLGFPGSLLNRCGFCVGGSTGLKDDYGLGVDGSCREAHIDCNGHLGGNSFADPCTGNCISTANMYDGGNLFDKGSRDCRGICQTETKSAVPLGEFAKDECSVCVAVPLPTVSVFKDCAGKCYTPGTKGMMAVKNNSTCGMCVTPDALQSENVTDACGNCAYLNKSCNCPGSRIDACGVCGGDNTTCLAVFGVFPPAVPSFTQTRVWVKGGALKNKHHTFCLLVREDVPPDGLDEEVFAAQVDGDGLHCEINATSGKYRFHLSIISDTLNVISNISSLFVIYPSDANGTSIEPTSAEIDNGNTTVNITVKGKYLNSTGVVYCNFTDPVSGNYTVFISNTTSERSENVTCEILLPNQSYAALLEVSLDGVRVIAGPFNFTFKTPAPKVEHIIHFSDVSLAAVIFDRPVNISKVNNCAALLTRESLDLLDKDDNCTWASPFQLVIGLPRHIDGQSIVLKFLDGVITIGDGKFVVPSTGINVTIPAVNTDPIAVLRGPSVVPSCASFILYGHQSDTNGGGDLEAFNWTVQPSAINNSLHQMLLDATTAKKPYIEISSALLDSTEYTFSLNVTTSNGHSSIANWTVRRLDSPIVILVLESSIEPSQGPVAVDQTITLIARADLPSCVKMNGNVSFMWTTNNPKVRFDFDQMSSRTYVIKPFALPNGENVTFEVRVWIGENVANAVNSSITFLTKTEMLASKIKGGPKLVIGTGSGEVRIDAKASSRFGRRTSRLVYQWKCLEETGNPCYKYGNDNSTAAVLFEQPYTLAPQLRFPANFLRPDSVLRLNLVVIDEERRRSDPRNLTIEVYQGDVPQVVIESVRANGLETSLQDESQAIYVIPPESTVVVSGIVNHAQSVPTFGWHCEPELMIEPITEFVRKSDTDTVAILTIRPGSLITGASYQIHLTAAYKDQPTGISEVTLMVLPPVTGCMLNIPAYTALSQVTTDLQSCAALKGLRPLTFRLLVQQNIYSSSALIPLTSPQYHLPLTFLGPPALTNSTTNVFILEVCHALGDCANFSSGIVNVIQPTPTDVALFGKTVMESANRSAALGMYLDALSLHAIYFLALEHDNSSQSAIAGEHVPAAVQAAELLNSSPCKDPVCFADMFSYMSLIPINDNNTAVHVFNAVRNAVLRLNESGLDLPFSGGQRAIWILEKILRYVNTSDANLTSSLVSTEDLLEQILARNLHLGDREEMVDEKGDRVTILEYSFLEHNLETSSHNRTLTVHFGNPIKDRYKLWDCIGKTGNNESCLGVVAQVHMYPNFVPFTLDVNHTISDVVAISLLSPQTGSHMQVEEMDPDENPLTTVSLQLRSPPTEENFSPICHIWDEASKKWTADGVTTVENEEGKVDCQTGKLSPIVVLWIDPGLSAGAIAAIVIACVAFIVGVTVAAILIHRRLTTKTLRVTPPNGIPMSYSEPRYH